MGERLILGTPTSIARARSSTERAGLKFSPTNPQTFEAGSIVFNLTSPNPGEVFTIPIKSAEIRETVLSVEDQVQKPAILNPDHIQTAREMALSAARRLKEYAISIKLDPTKPWVLFEGIEWTRALVGLARGGLTELPAVVAAAILIEGLRIVIPNEGSPVSEDSSFLEALKVAVQETAEQQIEQKIAEKIVPQA